jgi:hypothetical protein
MEIPHKHHNHIPKRIREYLFELLSTFIAVILAFLSQYYFEYRSNRSIEHELMVSLLADLRTDIKNIDELSSHNNEAEKCAKQIFDICNGNFYAKSNQIKLYQLSEEIGHLALSVNFSQSTINQLKNSGGMLLVTDNKIRNMITDYDNEIRHLELFSSNEASYKREFTISSTSIFYAAGWKFSLLNDSSDLFLNKIFQSTGSALMTSDKYALLKYANNALIFVGTRLGISKFSIYQKERALQLITLIQSRYHIE